VKRYKGTICFEGLPGGGKTYLMVEEAVKYLDHGGAAVYVHRDFDFFYKDETKVHRFVHLVELADVQVGLILIDEAPLFMSSRAWKEFPERMIRKVTTIRKTANGGVRLLFTAVDFSMVDNILRMCTAEVVRVSNPTGRMLVIKRYRPRKGAVTKEGRFGTNYKWMRKRIFDAYDTYNLVVPV